MNGNMNIKNKNESVLHDIRSVFENFVLEIVRLVFLVIINWG